MPLYVILMNWTDKGLQGAKESLSRLDQTKKFVDSLGCKMVSFLYTLGEYDCIATIEAPSDEVFMKFMLSFGAQGNVRRTALKAWTETDAAKIFSLIQPPP